MKSILAVYLLALAPSTALGVCNADNVLRALQANSAKASPFCSTYTLPPPDQPLPTYVSQYPASRVSSGCSCLITTTPTPPADACKSNRITNGNFETTVNYAPASWTFAGQVPSPAFVGNESYTLATSASSNGNTYASFYVYNGPPPDAVGSTFVTTYIKQNIPSLCTGTTYKLTYTSVMTINGGQPGRACNVRISLADQQLVFIGPPNGDPPPFTSQTRETTFTYLGTRQGNVFTVEFSCTAPAGFYRIDDISLVGV